MDREQLRRKQLLNTIEAAEYLGISKHTLDTWRYKKNPKGPKFIDTGSIKYTVRDLDKWLEQHIVEPEIDFAANG